MKKFSFTLLFAVAAMAAVSCENEIAFIEENPQVEFEPKVITAKSDDGIVTKTSLSGVNVLWSDTDQIKGYDGGEVHTSTATAISRGGAVATFTFGSVSVSDDLRYLGYPAANISDIDDDYLYITIPSVQTATAGSFADGANVAVADGLVDDEEVQFKNVGGLLSFIINNDNITSVKLAANEDMTGTGIAESDGTSVIDEGVKSVTVSGTIANGSEYYAVVYPGTYTGLTITVTRSDGKVAKYTNPNSLNVDRNDNISIAELTIPDGKWSVDGPEYIWELSSTNKFTAFGTGTTYSSMTWTPALVSSTGTPTCGTVTPAQRGQQLGSSSAEITEMTITGTGYTTFAGASNAGINSIDVTIGTAKNKTITAAVTVGGTEMTAVTSSYTPSDGSTPGTITFTSAVHLFGDIVITLTQASGSGAMYFHDVAINPDRRTAQTLSFLDDSYAVEVGESTFANPGLTGAQTTVTYSSSVPSVATVNPSTGLVTLVSAGTTVITATAAADATYKEGSASYTLTVNSSPVSIATVIAASSGDDIYTRGIVAQVNAKGFIITDGTDNLQIYQNATPSVSVGDDVKVSGTRGAYNNVAQVSSPLITTVSTGNAVTRSTLTAITSSNATGHTVSDYVSVHGTISKVSSNYRISISGTTVYAQAYQYVAETSYTDGTLESLEGRTVTATGYVAGNSSSVIYIALIDLVIDQSVDYLAVSPNSLSWSNSNAAKTINVTCNTDDSYSVDYSAVSSWLTVSDDGDGTVTVTPKEAAANNSGDIVINHSGGSLSETITCSQSSKTVVTIAISDVATANSWSNGTQYQGFDIDANVSISITAGYSTTGNTGKYYTSNSSWRIYESNSPTVTVTASGGHTLSKITFTYDSGKNGVITYGGENKTSNTAISVSGTSAGFSVTHSSGSDSGNVQITSITVEYN